jgi:hypothetical protein
MRTCFLLLLATMAAQALPLLTIPNAANFSLTPNSSFSLPFSITADADNFVVITSVQGTITRSVGEFYLITDVLSNFVANNSYALPPGSSVWTESSTPFLVGTTADAAGIFNIPANVTLGPASGNLFITYDLYNFNPFIDANAINTGSGTLQALYTVDFTAPAAIPEPGFFTLTGFFCVALMRSYQKRNNSRVASSCGSTSPM